MRFHSAHALLYKVVPCRCKNCLTCNHRLRYYEGDDEICLLCGTAFCREILLLRLEEACRERWASPISSPWTAAERSQDPT